MEYWKKVDLDGNTTTVESHSYSHEVPGAIQITKEEYDEFIASLPPPGPPPEPLVFTPANPELGVEQRMAHVEEFLTRCYPA